MPEKTDYPIATKASSLPRVIIDAIPVSVKIAKSIDGLTLQLVDLERQLMTARKDPIQLARSFVAFHRLKDKLETFTKAFGAIYDDYKKTVIPETFDAAGISHVPLSEGFRVGTSTKTYASIKEGMKDKAFQWLRRKDVKLGDLIQETVNSQSLSAAFHYRMTEENKTAPEELFNVHPVNTTSVTKTATKEN